MKKFNLTGRSSVHLHCDLISQISTQSFEYLNSFVDIHIQSAVLSYYFLFHQFKQSFLDSEIFREFFHLFNSFLTRSVLGVHRAEKRSQSADEKRVETYPE